MSTRLIEETKTLRRRGPRTDIGSTVSAWIWTAYFAAVSAAIAWWVLPS